MDRANLGQCGARGTSFVGATASLLERGGVTALALVVLAGCASDNPPPRRGERFEGAGGPGRPSLFVSPAGEPFRAPPGQAYPVAVWFKGADANGDGKLTRDEFVADAARFFTRLDANKDGAIDGFELKAYETEIVPEITEDRRAPQAGGAAQSDTFRNGGGGGGGGRRRRGGQGGSGQGGGQGGGGPGQATPQASGAAPYGLLGEREPVAGADLNLDSRITLANFKTRAEQRFARLDLDGKGYLVLTELPKTQAQRQAERQRAAPAAKPPG